MKRNGLGWRLLLAPFSHGPREEFLPDDGRPYTLTFDKLKLAVLDVANEGIDWVPDTSPDDVRQAAARATKARADKYQRWGDWLADRFPSDSTGESWLFLHKPLFASAECHAPAPGAAPECKQQVEQADKDKPITALRSRLSRETPRFDLIFAGDTHMFQFFAPDRGQHRNPPQIVAGMSGTLLEDKTDFDDAVLKQPVKADLFGRAGKLWMHRGFGYLVLTKEGGAWSAALHDPDGKLVLTCELAAQALDRAQSDFPCK
jgi:hypothetical protein